MKVSAFLRSLSTRSSRYIIHQDEYSEPEFEADHDDQYCTTTTAAAIGASASLTVWRKSLLFSCHGFTVIDSNGDLVYRVDNYMGGRPEEIVLMDGSGNSLLTLVRTKKLQFSYSWQVYKGEGSSEHGAKMSTKPMYTVKRQFNIIGSTSSTKVLAHVYKGSSEKHHTYTIRGSYSNRSCKILDGWRNVVAEIKKKEVTVKGGGGVSFGMEVFVLVVQPGFDQGVAMGLVLLLDQMFS